MKFKKSLNFKVYILKYLMNLSGPGITYLLMVIPTLFALVVVGQGVYKIVKEEREDGAVITLFGVIFLAIVGAAYYFFIR